MQPRHRGTKLSLTHSDPKSSPDADVLHADGTLDIGAACRWTRCHWKIDEERQLRLHAGDLSVCTICGHDFALPPAPVVAHNLTCAQRMHAECLKNCNDEVRCGCGFFFTTQNVIEVPETDILTRTVSELRSVGDLPRSRYAFVLDSPSARVFLDLAAPFYEEDEALFLANTRDVEKKPFLAYLIVEVQEIDRPTWDREAALGFALKGYNGRILVLSTRPDSKPAEIDFDEEYRRIHADEPLFTELPNRAYPMPASADINKQYEQRLFPLLLSALTSRDFDPISMLICLRGADYTTAIPTVSITAGADITFLPESLPSWRKFRIVTYKSTTLARVHHGPDIEKKEETPRDSVTPGESCAASVNTVSSGTLGGFLHSAKTGKYYGVTNGHCCFDDEGKMLPVGSEIVSPSARHVANNVEPHGKEARSLRRVISQWVNMSEARHDRAWRMVDALEKEVAVWQNSTRVIGHLEAAELAEMPADHPPFSSHVIRTLLPNAYVEWALIRMMDDKHCSNENLSSRFIGRMEPRRMPFKHGIHNDRLCVVGETVVAIRVRGQSWTWCWPVFWNGHSDMSDGPGDSGSLLIRTRGGNILGILCGGPYDQRMSGISYAIDFSLVHSRMQQRTGKQLDAFWVIMP